MCYCNRSDLFFSPSLCLVCKCDVDPDVSATNNNLDGQDLAESTQNRSPSGASMPSFSSPCAPSCGGGIKTQACQHSTPHKHGNCIGSEDVMDSNLHFRDAVDLAQNAPDPAQASGFLFASNKCAPPKLTQTL